MKFITKILKGTTVNVRSYMEEIMALVNYKPTADDYKLVKKELTKESKVQFEEKTDLEKDKIVVGFIKAGSDYKGRFKELGIRFAYDLAMDFECIGGQLDELAVILSEDSELTTKIVEEMDLVSEYIPFITDFLLGSMSAFSSAPTST